MQALMLVVALWIILISLCLYYLKITSFYFHYGVCEGAIFIMKEKENIIVWSLFLNWGESLEPERFKCACISEWEPAVTWLPGILLASGLRGG